MYIEVAVALPVFGTYTYAVPDPFPASMGIGHRVLVPFGPRRVTGYVIGEGAPNGHGEIKEILDAPDGEALFPDSMVDFFRWVAHYYVHPLGQVIQTALPGGLNVADVTVFSLSEEKKQGIDPAELTSGQREVMDVLKNGDRSSRALRLALRNPIPSGQLHALVAKGLLIRKIELRKGGTLPKTERIAAFVRMPEPGERLSEVRLRVLSLLKDKGEMAVPQLRTAVSTTSNLISRMAASGHIRLFKRRVFRDPLGSPIHPAPRPQLTEEQQAVVDGVLKHAGRGFATFLLTGVTGSGKTEVYLRLAEQVIERGRSVLVLVPEIALISQMVHRFRSRFGERIAVFHSGLSAGERYDQWVRIARGDVPIAIGARSAVFSPFADLGLIVVDEEHDGSYKQESGLRYHARDLAVLRARFAGAVALLGSATPSVQSLHNVEAGKFTRLTMRQRVGQRSLPEITVVDLRDFRDMRGPHRFFSPQLIEALSRTLNSGCQALLFLNRRGFASFPVCGVCGQAVRCRNCDISMTFHQRANAFKCHYCGYSKAPAAPCAFCGSSEFNLLGMGTEKVEEQVRALFPEARVARLDQDTAARKGAMVRILRDLRNRAVDILVGTQMVAKGHDFPHITLVGIICADLSLNFPDFRAGERTFQLLAQVAGRAGRGETPGRVILQTYAPEHFSIEAARRQDFAAFYRKEIEYRRALQYPPFSRMAQFTISGKDRERTRDHSEAVALHCRKLSFGPFRPEGLLEILGPIEAPLARIAGRYRWQLLVKAGGNRAIQQLVRRLMETAPGVFGDRQVTVSVDIDPYMVM